MKYSALLLIAALAVFIGACANDSSTGPVDPQSTSSLMKAAPSQVSQDVGISPLIDPRDIEARVRAEIQKMTRVLGLSDRQQAAIANILRNQYKMELQLARQYQNDPIALRRALAQLQQRVDNAIMQLLTREQLAKWRVWKALSTKNG
jgi:hypothetical protein